MAAVLAAWGVVQWLSGQGFINNEHGFRAQAIFATPNTLAAAINLALAPLLAYYLLGRGGRREYGLLLLLFSGLLASQSRGGYLGLLAALLFFMSYAGRQTILPQLRRYREIFFGFVAVAVFFKLYAWFGSAHWSLDNVAATVARGDSSGRREIYGMAWPLLKEHFWQGIGYFNFGYYWEMHKVPPFLDSHTLFVHNDYLQLALETGVAGIGLFLALIVSLYFHVLRHRRQAVSEQRLPLILPTVAITSMLAHALVDFPFYIPVLIAVFGAYVGVIDQQLAGMGSWSFRWPGFPRLAIPGLRPAFVKGLAQVAVVVWLGLPAFAETAAAYGLHRLQQGDARWGLYWHQVARSLQPRDAGYYWREGVILRDLGVEQSDARLVSRSDAMFAQGVEVNPFEVNNLLARIALHRQYGKMLAQPASHEEIMAWILRAKRLQPYSDAVQAEHARCLAFAGQRAQAIEEAHELLRKRPHAVTARKLLEEVSRG